MKTLKQKAEEYLGSIRKGLMSGEENIMPVTKLVANQIKELLNKNERNDDVNC